MSTLQEALNDAGLNTTRTPAPKARRRTTTGHMPHAHLMLGPVNTPDSYTGSRINYDRWSTETLGEGSLASHLTETTTFEKHGRTITIEPYALVRERRQHTYETKRRAELGDEFAKFPAHLLEAAMNDRRPVSSDPTICPSCHMRVAPAFTSCPDC